MRIAALACLIAGCGFEHGRVESGDGGLADARDARPIDGPCVTYSTQVDTCTVGVGLGTGDLVLTGSNTYDTDTNMLVTPSGTLTPAHAIVTTPAGDLDFLFVASFTVEVGATLRVVGDTVDRPLGIASTGVVQIDGTIDLSDNGAGARNDAACTSEGEAGTANTGGGGGGGGGGMKANGGHGGPGNKDGAADTPFGAGGIAIARPSFVLGGCDGGTGGAGSGSGGIGGNGGGAIAIASATSITISSTGVIHAGGGGGRGGTGNGGAGGGGGSGGMILLESGVVTIAGKLAANGGGGGEGADGTDGMGGLTGLVSTSRASGGSGLAAEGGDAGSGGAGSVSQAGQDATQLKNGGGGGGGGGVGFIAIGPATAVVSGAVISPPAEAWP